MSEHPDLEKLPLEIDGIPVRETIREIFCKPENGTPDNISKAGCLALAKQSRSAYFVNMAQTSGFESALSISRACIVWNAWRQSFPSLGGVDVIQGFDNKADFSSNDFASDTDSDSGPVTTSFEGFSFGHQASFRSAKFAHVNFRRVNFGIHACFEDAHFQEAADFDDANFGSSVSFVNTRFESALSFVGCQFLGAVDFSTCDSLSQKFSGHVCFDKAIFKGPVSFNGRHFANATSFKSAHFAVAPTFHGCELHQDTSFEGAIFPEATGSEDAARAYRTLKLAFSKQQAIREEQRFFRLEMAEETLLETGLKRWLFWAYNTFSDYGFSVMRPFLLLTATWLVFAQIYGAHASPQSLCVLGQTDCRLQGEWFTFSLQQALPLPGFEQLDSAIKGVSVGWLFLHKTLSLIALFLIGLALRNLFKLK
jgi:uncharacterized protein YjbI with pentapeptide repeats